MNLKAKLIQVLPIVSGQGKNGEWKKLDFVVETDAQYPQKVCFSLWNDKIDESKLQIGKVLSIDFDPSSREYNGRWFTELRAWKIQLESEMAEAPANYPPDQEYPYPNGEEELPF